MGGHMKTLVAYFSASGKTAKVATKLAKVLDADIFEIRPTEPYTKADLNWMNKKSRSSVEMRDRSSRPRIATVLNNFNEYDTVYVGFPIWWYREPSIIDTFLESYDFTGKTVVPFATSGSSKMGETADNFRRLIPGARILEGDRLPANISEKELQDWTSQSW